MAKKQVSSSETMIVMSKLPFDVSFLNAKGQERVIKGMKASTIVATKGALGYYATTQLDKDDWEYFSMVHKGARYFKNNVIIADDSLDNTKAKAKEHQLEKTGLEQKTLDSFKDVRKSTSDEAKSNPIIVE